MRACWRAAALALLLWCCAQPALAQTVGTPELSGRAWLLIDEGNTLPIAQRNASSRQEAGALTKLMVAYIAFNALKAGRLQMQQTLLPPAAALSAGGPSMHLVSGQPVSIRDLLYGVIILSANDATLTLAEALTGGEAGLVVQMNQEAQRLGLADTQYRNATGQTTAGHYTSARDLARLAVALTREHPDYYPIFGNRAFVYRDQRQENRNRLLWLDPTIDGLKTGQTDAGGWSIVASALRGNRRLIAIELGAPDEASRTQDCLRLLNYGYQAFDTVKLYRAGEVLKTLEVWQGERPQVDIGFQQDLLLAVPINRTADLKVSLQHRTPILAPIRQGEALGTLQVSLDGQALGEYPVLALQTVAAGNWPVRQWDRLRLWLKHL